VNADSTPPAVDIATSAAYPRATGRNAALYRSFAAIEERHINHDGDALANTGLEELDQLTGGFGPGNVVVIAGRPMMGKTSLAHRLATHAAVEQDIATALFSFETSPDATMTRLLATAAGVDQKRIRTGTTRDEEVMRVAQAASRFEKAPLWVEQPVTPTLDAIRSRVTEIGKETPLRLVVIDYLQLMETSGAESRHQGVASISRGLKRLACELELTIAVVSQCSRAPEQRGGNNKRPQLTDLRDSGAIEDDADVVLFLYRQEYYDMVDGRDPREPDRDGYFSAGKAEIIVAKQRTGPTAYAFVRFDARSAKFSDQDTSIT
jgi:replicative DNA helicase